MKGATVDQDKSNVVADGADDLEDLRRIVFPHLAIEHVRDLAIFAARNKLDVWNHVAGEVRFEDGQLRLTKMVKLSGLLARADASGKYSHVGEARWDRDEAGKPLRVHVPVYRWFNGEARECWVSAKWESYYPGPGFWDKFDEHQLWKCALALGLKVAVPDLGNLYTTDEMAQKLAALPKAPPAACPVNEDELPTSAQSLRVWMIDYGFSDDAKRRAVIAEFRRKWKVGDDDENPLLYREMAKAIATNPAEYGGRRPEAA